MKKLTIALMAALVLTGCGKNPTGTDGPERVVSAHPYASKAPSTAKLPASTTAAKSTTTTAKAATTTAPAAKTTTPAKATTTTTPATTTASTTTATVTDPNAPGSLAVNIKVSGTATVAKLALKIFDPAAPDQALDAPLALTAGAASWSEKEVGAGTYTMQVKALAADGSVLGSGTTSASVKAGEPTEVNLDLKVNTSAEAVPPTGGGSQVNTQSTGATPTPAPSATPTPKPSATPTPAPTPTPQVGGTLGLQIEVL